MFNNHRKDKKHRHAAWVMRCALAELKERTNQMAVSQAQFDTDLAAYNTAVTNYITAVEAFIAIPAVADLTAEDTAVQAASTAVATAAAKIPAPPVTSTP